MRPRKACLFALRFAVFFLVAPFLTLFLLVLTVFLATLSPLLTCVAFFLLIFRAVFFLVARLILAFFVVRFLPSLATFCLTAFFGGLLAGFFFAARLPTRFFLAALTPVAFPLVLVVAFLRCFLGSCADNSGTRSESSGLMGCCSSDPGASGGVAGSGIGSHIPGPPKPGPLESRLLDICFTSDVMIPSCCYILPVRRAF